jgi:hypothetical protein
VSDDTVDLVAAFQKLKGIFFEIERFTCEFWDDILKDGIINALIEVE